jgi:hypothetical protein
LERSSSTPGGVILSVSNEAKLAPVLTASQLARDTLLRQIDALCQTQLNFKPSAQSWSVGEVAHHVFLGEKMIQGLMNESRRRSNASGSVTNDVSFRELPVRLQGIPDFFLQLPFVQIPFSIMKSFIPQAVQFSLLANPFVKAKAAPSLEPQTGIGKSELVRFLSDVRRETRSIVASFGQRDLSGIRWRHPILGSYDVYGSLEFLANHEKRHLVQIERIKGAQDFPAGS